MPKVAGVYPPIPTPFSHTSSLDEEGLQHNLSLWNRFPFSGYVVLGSNGESVHLEEQEKLRLIEQVRKNAPADRQVIAGTGLFSTDQTIELSRRAADVGADGVLVLPPFYFRGQMSDNALRTHFESVAEASPVPIIIYNMPANTGLDLSADLLVALSSHPNIAGIKDSSGSIAKLAEIRRRCEPGFAILAGSAGFLLPALAVGAHGGVLALANIAPKTCLAIYRCAQEGRWEEARVLQLRISRANRAVTRQWGVPALKQAMDLLGLIGGPPRRPLQPLDPKTAQTLQAILTEAGIQPMKEAE